MNWSEEEWAEQPPANEEIAEGLRALLSKANVKNTELRGYLFRHGGVNAISDGLRAALWKAFLGIDSQAINRGQAEKTLGGVALDFPNQSVVKADAERTRPHLKEFQSDTARASIERILTLYCKRRGHKYVQGMNELLAPFFLLKMDPIDSFVSFNSFVAQYMPPSIFCDNFTSLQLAFHLFRLLLLYHDPVICNRLDQYSMTPDLYATPWFLTLFSRNLSVRALMALWDFYLLEADPTLNYFVALVIVIKNRDTILSADPSTLPITLMNMTVSSKEEVLGICKLAKKYDMNTPKSFRKQLHTTLFSSPTQGLENKQQVEGMKKRVHDAICLPVSMREVIPPSGPSGQAIVNPMQLHFFVVDCRSLDEFQAGRLPTAFHLNPEVLSDPEQLLAIIDGLKDIRNDHICVFGSAHVSSEVDVVVLQFLQRGFKRVGIAREGYESVHKIFLEGRLELVDHDPKMCLVCSPKSTKGFGKMSNMFKDTTSKAIGDVQKMREKMAINTAQLGNKMKMGFQGLKVPELKQSNAPAIGSAKGDRPKSLDLGPLNIFGRKGAKPTTSSDPPTDNGGGSDVEVWDAATDTVFTIGDDGMDEAEPPVSRSESALSLKSPIRELTGDLISGPEVVSRNPVDVSLDEVRVEALVNAWNWLQDDNVHFFLCLQIVRGKAVNRYLVVSPEYIVCINAHRTDIGWGIVQWKQPLTNICRLKTPRRFPTRVTFEFRDRAASSSEAPISYQHDIYKMDQLLMLLKKNLDNLRVLLHHEVATSQA